MHFWQRVLREEGRPLGTSRKRRKGRKGAEREASLGLYPRVMRDVTGMRGLSLLRS